MLKVASSTLAGCIVYTFAALTEFQNLMSTLVGTLSQVLRLRARQSAVSGVDLSCLDQVNT